jgi:SpoVK/Ycf46/Vps4 family AAA+-type ATPase
MRRKALAVEILGGKRVSVMGVALKYVGETEKNLHRSSRNTEKKEIILLFDEADALFGKRTEVKDAHDRFTNI